MDRKDLMAQFNDPTRLGTLATADSNGKPDNAVFSALQMVDENTVKFAIGDNRSYANLKQNPQATFIFFHPDANPYNWKGARIYLKMEQAVEEGEEFNGMVAMVRQMAGDDAANHVKAVITFNIEEVRPLIDSSK